MFSFTKKIRRTHQQTTLAPLKMYGAVLRTNLAVLEDDCAAKEFLLKYLVYYQ